MASKLIWQPSYDNGKSISVDLDLDFAKERMLARPTPETILGLNEMAVKIMEQCIGFRQKHPTLTSKPFEFYGNTGLVKRISTEMVAGITTSVNPNPYVNLEADIDSLERLREGTYMENLNYRSRGIEHPIQRDLLLKMFDYWFKRSVLL